MSRLLLQSLLAAALIAAALAASAQSGDEGPLRPSQQSGLTPAERDAFLQYEDLASRIRLTDAETLLRDQIRATPSSFVFHRALVQHLQRHRPAEHKLRLEAVLDLMGLLPPGEDATLANLARSAAEHAWNAGVARAGLDDDGQVVALLVFAHALVEPELDLRGALPVVRRHLFERAELPAEHTGLMGRAMLKANTSIRRHVGDGTTQLKLLAAMRRHFGPAIEAHIRSDEVLDWTLEASMYWEFTIAEFQRLSALPPSLHAVDLGIMRPALKTLSSLIVPEQLTEANIGHRVTPQIVASQAEFLAREDRPYDVEVRDLLMVLSCIEDFNNRRYQVYLLDELIGSRVDDPGAQAIYRRVMDDLVAEIVRLLEMQDIPSPAAYGAFVGETLELLHFIRLQFPDLILTEEADERLAELEVALISEFASANLYMEYRQRVMQALPAEVTNLAKEIPAVTQDGFTPKWLPHFRELLDLLMRRSGGPTAGRAPLIQGRG